MIKHDKILKEIHHLLLDSRNSTDYFTCKIVSAVFASLVSHDISKCYIIESKSHAVVYDGINTWDLSIGVMFENYKYPDESIPEPVFLPHFKNWYVEKLFNNNYSLENLKKAKEFISIKEVKKIGELNGTSYSS